MLLVGLVVAVVVLLSHRQLLKPTALTTRDHVDSYLRLQQYRQELSDGHWPQNFPDALRGGGHAFPRFYPPLAHGSAVGLYAVTGNVISATHLSGLSAIVLAGITCFLVLRALAGATLPAALGAIFYATFPYQFVTLDIRGAFAETWALVFYPLILAGFIISLRRGRPPWWLPLVIAGVLASHMVMSAWALPSLLAVTLFVTAPEVTRAGLLRTGLGVLLGLGLMGPWIVPTLAEVSGLRAADPETVWATPQAVAGKTWAFYEQVFRVFPWWKELEGLLLVVGVIGFGLNWRSRDAGIRLCWASLVAAALLMGLVGAAEPVWRLIPQPLRYIQFSQRLLGVSSFVLVVTLAVALSWLNGKLAWLVTVPAGVLLALHGGRLGSQILPRSGETGSTILSLLETNYPDRGFTVVGEYLPRGAEPERLAAAIQATLDRVGQPPLVSWNRTAGHYEATVMLEHAEEVLLPLVAYNFHSVQSETGKVSRETRGGQLTVRLEAGTHRLRITRRWPASLKAGLALALLSLAAWVMLMARRQGMQNESAATTGGEA